MNHVPPVSPRLTGRLLRSLCLAAAILGVVACDRASHAPRQNLITVYKTATCQCCALWVQHLKDAGFVVEVHNETAMSPLKTRLGVSEALASCHTALVGGYVIEGHVPAADIRRLLSEHPAAKGLAVPGMPVGSPGMEYGDRKDRYDVLLFAASGEPRVFARHGP